MKRAIKFECKDGEAKMTRKSICDFVEWVEDDGIIALDQIKDMMSEFETVYLIGLALVFPNAPKSVFDDDEFDAVDEEVLQ